jgi:3',5'-cyclic AMP phosphodiesterase CpdA
MSEKPVAIISDLHLEPEFGTGLLETFEQTLTQIATHDPGTLVILGDIVHETDPATDERFLQAVIDRTTDFGVPCRYVLGNHDVESLDPRTVTDAVGHDRWAVDQKRERVFLDSSAPDLSGSRGEIPAEQFAGLQEELSAMRNAIVFVHHPIHYHDVSNNYWFARHPEEAFCGNKRAVSEMLSTVSEHVSAVVNGHLHEWDWTTDRGVSHFTINSFNKTRNPAGESGSYAVLDPGDSLRLSHFSGDGTVHRVEL